ncbi:MAG: LysM peptidoglycan-binding domain-containing protein [Candidatus Omnitrophica bacterium]|nr:LysM peptidoglycan-binding domain-containing protein [Candidatus Omnitrophota bacterium]
MNIKYMSLVLAVLLLSGCASVQKEKPAKTNNNGAVADTEIDIKMKQLLAISETSLEVSRRAEEKSDEALAKSTETAETSAKALEAVNKATEAAVNAVKYVDQEVAKAVDTSNRNSKTAMDHATREAERAIAASNEAVKASNAASEKAIAVANQTMAEVNRLRATIKMEKEVAPILEEEPAVSKPVSEKTYTIVRGDTLSGIAYKYYNDSSKWPVIYNANRDVIKDANVLTPGTRIVIP